MRQVSALRAIALFALCAVLTGGSSYGGGASTDVVRYFHRGDGRIKLVSAKNGASFNGRYREGNGIYNRSAIETIHRIFGAGYGDPISEVSVRLIELLDFLEDRLHPGAQITVVSGWRSPEYNTQLRNKGRLAAKASLHQYGMAADIEMEGVPSRQVWNYVKELGFGGAGYYNGQLVHVDVGPARSWDEKTSGVGTDISEENKLIGLVTDYDVYLPGDTLTLRFIRMTAFPIGVNVQWEVNRVGEDGSLRKVDTFEPSFGIEVRDECPQFGDIGQMLGIRYGLPLSIAPGRYKIRAGFCRKTWEAMPSEIWTPEFEVVRP